jgi:glycosyltransferase involved in cell wall biosynthesis
VLWLKRFRAGEFERRYGNVCVIALPERTPGGPGLPSNIGIKAATGKYVAFLDHDDAARPDMLEKLAGTAEREDTDVTFCFFVMRPEGSEECYPPYDIEYWAKIFEPGFTALPLDEQKKAYLKLSPAPWRKLYNREYFKRNNILFPVADFFMWLLP